MARRDFAVRDLIEIYLHWQAGSSIRRIASSLGTDRNTVRKYVRRAEEAGITRKQPRSEEEWARFIREAFPFTHDPFARCASFEDLEPYKEHIREALKENRASTVWQRLKDEAGIGVSESTFRRYIRVAMPEVLLVSRPTVWRPEVAPGEEAQIDFGYLGLWEDPSGVRKKAWSFVMVLSFSRHMFVRVVTRVDRGGCPQRLVLDNLKGGVIKPDLYDPQFNRSYAEMGRHYSTLIDPCRTGHPKDKPRVERMVPYVRDSLWRGRRFESLDAANGEAIRWCNEVAGKRIHGTTGQRPIEAFIAEEKAELIALPPEPWEMAFWQQGKVAPDCHVSVGRSLYSVPFKYMGQTLDVRFTDNLVQFFKDSELVKTHKRVPQRHRQTDIGDLPEDKVAFFQRNPQWCLSQARKLGEPVHEVILDLLSVNTLFNLRQAQGIIRLADRYGPLRLNAGCDRALAFGDPRYKTVKNILEKGLDQQDDDVATPAAAPAFLRGQREFQFDGGIKQ